MLKNYFKIAWRNLTRSKVSSFINIFGLAVGMGVAMLNGLWIWDELSFNKYHGNYDRIGQVMCTEIHDGKRGVNNSMSYPLALELKKNYSGNFKHIVLGSWTANYILAAGDKKISAAGAYLDAGAPDMLTLKMLYGSRAGLKDPYSIILSASIAKAIFGDRDPVNEMMRINNKTDVKVTGVYEDLPLNSHFTQNKFFAPFDLWVMENDWVRKRAATDWANHFIRIYGQIAPNTTIEQVNVNIKYAERKHAAEFKKGMFRDAQDFFHPMSKWHLYKFKGGLTDDGPIGMVRLVGIIGIIVLLLACINFMNLSTARSEKRAKEVGIRKTIGSARWQLIGQFFSESFLVVVCAFVVALLLVACSLSWFNDLSAKQMAMPWGNLYFWLFSMAFIIITALIAGSYPALYLSAFKPIKVLKGTFRIGRWAAVPRKVLVVSQFSISVILVIGTVVVYKQIQYAKDRPVGYDQNGLLMIEMKSPDFQGKHDLLRQELKNTGAVAEMSESMGPITSVWSNNNGFTWKDKDPNINESFGSLAVTSGHGKTVGWQFLQGRDFSDKLPTDSDGLVMNETALKYMGLQNPVGETVGWKFWNSDTTKYYTVLGVIKDMVMESPYEPVKPTFFFIKPLNGGVSWINIKIAPTVSVGNALPKIATVFKQLVPAAPFEYTFADETYGQKFALEVRISKLAAFFGALAIFISCLGLFGLASFVAEQRTKEIGVRKILGASVFNLWGHLSKEFVQLIVIACVVATPVAWYFMNDWIQKYSYRTNISWWIFVATGIGALIITLGTVSFQSIRAALMNPVKSLRSE